MPRNGSGTYNRLANPAYTNGTVNDGTEIENEANDFAQALTDSLTANGEKQSTANQPMGGFRHTAVGNPTARNQYDSAANVQDGVLTTLTAVAGTNTITATAPLLMSAYVTGQMFHFVAAGANTGAVTLNVNAIGAKNVTRIGTTALISGDIVAGSAVIVVYDGTQFQILGLSYAALLAANSPFTGNNIHSGENAFTKTSAAGVKPAIALGPGSVNPGWSSDFHVQQIGPQTYIARQIGNGTVWIANNAWYDNTNWRAIGTGRGELIGIIGGTAGPYDTKVYNLDNGSGGTVAAGGIFTLTDMGSLVRVETSGLANSIVRRNNGGHIFNTFFNMTANDIGTATPSRVPAETGTDGFLRWQTLTNFKNVVSTASEAVIAYTGAGFAFSVANPIGAIPKTWYVVLRCVTAEHGYAVGEEVSWSMNDSAGSFIVNFSVTATTCYVTKTNATTLRIGRKSDGVTVNLTNGSWNWVFKLINN